MKSKTKLLTSIIAMMLCLVIAFTMTMFTTNTNQSVSASTRTIEISQSALDAQSVLNEFDSYDIEVKDNTSKFEGYATLSFSDFEDIDYVSSCDITEGATLKFETSFDYDTGTTTLNVLLADGEETTIIETVYGVALLSETGEVDIVFDFDGELIFLSELNNIETLDNVGWFTNLVKKAVNKVVSTVESVVDTTVKVLSTSKGAIGTVCTLAACAVVGVACAFIPGGQIVTTTCASIAGAVVGSVGFNLTAKAAQTQNSSITDDDISTYTTLGGIVGSAVSVCSCSTMSALKASQNAIKSGKKTFASSDKLAEHFYKHGSEFEGLYTNVDEYLDGANYVIENGQYVKELNGYIRFFGAKGKANYAFVGMSADGTTITTFGIRSVEDLAKTIPWLIK